MVGKLEQKDILRTEARRHRVMRDPRDENPDAALDIFLNNIDVPSNAIVAGYYPTDKEFDPLDILNMLTERGNICCLPVIEKDTRILKFTKWQNGDDLEQGAYKIPQPVVGNDTVWLRPDVLLMPLLAFDRRGNRLGQGGGYYDATLQDLRGEKQILAVGVAYAAQACLFKLPVEEHDQKLDWVITPKQAHDFRVHNSMDK